MKFHLTIRDRIRLSVYQDIIIFSLVFFLVLGIELLADFDDVLINWLFANKDNFATELIVNGLIATVFVGIYIGYRTTVFKRLLENQFSIETKLHASESHLRMMLDNSSTIIYAASSVRSGTSYISGNVKAILGYEPKEFEHPNFWYEIIHPEDREKVEKSFFSLYVTKSSELEFRVRHKDDSWRWIFNKTQLIGPPGGKHEDIVGTWVDRTERMNAQEDIRKSEERFQLAATATRDVVYDWDLVTNITWVNDQHYTTFGYSKGENILKGIDWWKEKLHPDDRDGILESMEITIQSKMLLWNEEYRFRKADGTYADVLDRAVLTYSPEGVPLKCTGTMSDLTENRKTEADLKKAIEKAEISVKVKSEFLANMSHEIRTPLNGIIGMTDMVIETTKLSNDQHRYLSTIKSSSETLQALINDILDFSKIDAGKLDLFPVVFSFRDEIPKSLQLLGLKASEKGLELIYRLSQDVPDQFIGDALRIQQILTNLVGNGIKFTEKGYVDISIHVESLIKNKVVLHFVISDTGIGIPAEKHSLMFREFTQADSSISRKYGGTGLGLAITKRLVEMMGGTIWFESEDGKGTTFHFTIELLVDKKDSNPRFIPGPVLKDVKVLIVEGNKLSSDYTSEILEHFKMKPVTVSNGTEAMHELERAASLGLPYPVVVLGITLPGKWDGFDLAEQIKADAVLKHTDIIVVSMSQKSSDRERFAALGITHFYSKPFNQSDLLDSLQILLAGRNLPDKNNLVTHPAEKDSHFAFFAQPSGGLKILLAEDNIVNQDVAASMLTHSGHKVTIAVNGDEAVKAIERESFDLVLMDVQMPVMNGYEATQKIRLLEKQTGQRMPIIGLTANAMVGDKQKCIEAGMDGYLSKPINMTQLLTTVANVQNSEPTGAISFAATSDGATDEVGRLLQRANNSKHAIANLVTLFDEEVGQLLVRIDNGIHFFDNDDISRACHSLRGCLVTMEMRGAAQIAGVIETLANEKEFVQMEAMFPALKMGIGHSVAAVKRLIQ